MKKKIAILGSTGSIGKQTLDVIASHPDHFDVEVLTANNSADELIQQAITYAPNAVVIGNEDKYLYIKEALKNEPIKVYAGSKAIAEVVQMGTVDMVLTAMVGFAGLEPTIRAIEAGKHIALANKETLVVAGDLISRLAIDKKVGILPVDSEHSAIFQCLTGEMLNPIHKILLTASGGPFRGKDAAFLANVTKQQALNHPNWKMGDKITIDSASLMNKGLEAIEARWLFNVKPSQIEVVVHPQSIIHSMVEFEDGSIKAQMGLPDMRLPIQYALSYPQRLHGNYPRFRFTDYPQLTFEQADVNVFRNLQLAFDAMNTGGNMPCILNAANEVAVDAFLNEKAGFAQMSDIIANTMAKVAFVPAPGYDDYMATDREARRIAQTFIRN
ncbi:1-deoxy-D-xylulose 5-phosphate reductoisomerase [Breznakibacter xylanolyticus]|uniref:1-deoxy-D-xylulose 5-phosphate reductoisomerase n=1 Tax=Breznakibacter xylanolyticus TaxID=990 RepID=A0A2W7MQ23_9BACT|nr:1-deoxy-D-xylulose-5-phosphate reductoisomerase [Breznakibacter xylanolyticus]PZX10305.1 1-deoxy-D-xylulose 5-phosphate reductoisomerase [Breznakibacter xylanolyticus]